MTLRTEGLWEGSVQRSDVPGLLKGAWMGRWLVLAWSFAMGRRREEEESFWCN